MSGDRPGPTASGPDHRRGRASSAPTLPTGSPARGIDVLVYDALTRAGRGAQSRLAARSGTASRIEPWSATFATRRSWRDAAADAKAVFHMAAQVAVTTSLVDPREDFEINVRGTLNLLEAMRAARRAGAADLRLDQQGLRRSRRYALRRGGGAPIEPIDSACARKGIGESAAARLPHALWLLEGRGRSIRARLCAQLRPADRGVPHELHLRPAADGHGGPGLGRAFPDPGARRPADHDLRRRLPGARHPRRGGCGATPTSAGLAAHRRGAGTRLQSRRRADECDQPAAAARRHRAI